MAAVRRAKVIFQLESEFGTHQKISNFSKSNRQMFPSGGQLSQRLKIFEVQGWKKSANLAVNMCNLYSRRQHNYYD